MNRPLVKGDLHNEKYESQSREALSKAAYAQAHNFALRRIEQDIKDLPAVRDEMAKLKGEIAALNRPVNLTTTLKQPAKVKTTPAQIDGLRAAAAIHLAGGVNLVGHESTRDTVRELLAKDGDGLTRRIAEFKLKSATNLGTTTDPSFGTDLVEADVRSFYKRTAARSCFAGLYGLAPTFLFGRSDSVIIPQRPKSSEGDLSGAWTAEGASIVAKDSTLSSTVLQRYKMAVLTTATNDLLRVTSGTLDLFSDMIRDDTAALLDSQAFDPSVSQIAGLRPASLYAGATTAASAGVTFAQIIEDIRQLKQWATDARMASPVLTMSDNRKLGLAMVLNSDEQMPLLAMVEAGNVFGIPILSSPYHPDDVVGIVDAGETMIAADPAEFDQNKHATIVMIDNVDPAPKMGDDDGVTAANSVHVSDAAGTVPASEVRSMFQTDAVVLRMVLPISYGLRTEGASSYLSGVAW